MERTNLQPSVIARFSPENRGNLVECLLVDAKMACNNRGV